ncbi:type II secretion system protein [Tichowtungia aerotolerans]|uniref:Prepilin-type N-terminal cleavage/methylation domain-containing protein n=1 Tax=Tichowtungia aerotolerans TaxID=2697043 RepID=A0A6P1MBN7_9BACT|nr:type II secretion system protein [Tichowtungia aerotolerans]QHI70513.1 prepilin-type N-terminal cleavage/methylation domain-containing protein [Tichowtungia aerotolerans]
MKPTVNNTGITLIEVMLSIVILAILAVVAVTALFYPTYLVVMSSIEQSAINAGNTEIEAHLNNYKKPITQGSFYTDGWTVSTTNDVVDYNDLPSDYAPGTGDKVKYVLIKTTVGYRDGHSVELVTYRSLEISSSER